MTIAVAVRTNTAVVFAADSKLTTRGAVGVDTNGALIFVDQTFDGATKIVADKSDQVMAMIAGHAAAGDEPIADVISAWDRPSTARNEADTEGAIRDLGKKMSAQNDAFWTGLKVDVDDRPWSLLVFAAAVDGVRAPVVWHLTLDHKTNPLVKVLPDAGVRLEGACDEALSLLYGENFALTQEIAKQLNIDVADISAARNKSRLLRPIDKLNFRSMPLQDAVDFAVFLAQVQVKMDRFLPGIPKCGGPIDVFVMQGGGKKLERYPGKTLRHPESR